MTEPTVDDWLAAGGPKELVANGMTYDWSCFTDMLGLCGCGEPGEVAALLLQLLTIAKRRADSNGGDDWPTAEECEAVMPRDIRAWLIWYWMEDRGWTEHGGNASGSWITPLGKKAIRVLARFIKLDDSAP